MADLRIVDAPVILQESITDDVKMPTGGLGNFSIRLGDIVWYVVTKEQLANKNYVDLSSKSVKDSLDAHIANKANPHQVTKAQVGLGNVDNTADVDKPVSNATKSAIITATTDMATKAYVNSKDGDLTTLTTTNKTSLVKAINEVVSVKANKDDVASSISNLTNNKADKATTLLGYGITDAYTKSEIDTNYGGVKTLYDKNVEAGAGANGWTATLVKDASGMTQQQVNDKTAIFYNTVADMVADTKLKAGKAVITHGYYAPNDGGGARYLIKNTATDYSIPIVNNLHAVFADSFDIRKFGIRNNGTLDQTTEIKRMVNYADSRVYEIDFLNFSLMTPKITHYFTGRTTLVGMGFRKVHHLKNLTIANNKTEQLVQGVNPLLFLPDDLNGSGKFKLSNVKFDPYVSNFKINNGEADGFMCGFVVEWHKDSNWVYPSSNWTVSNYDIELDDIEFLSPAISYNLACAGIFTRNLIANNVRGDYWGIMLVHHTYNLDANNIHGVFRDDLHTGSGRLLVTNLIHEEAEIADGVITRNNILVSNSSCYIKTSGKEHCVYKLHRIGTITINNFIGDNNIGSHEFYGGTNEIDAKKIVIDNLTVKNGKKLRCSAKCQVNNALYTNFDILDEVLIYNSYYGNLVINDIRKIPFCIAYIGTDGTVDTLTVSNIQDYTNVDYGLIRNSGVVIDKINIINVQSANGRLVECVFNEINLDNVNVNVEGFGNFIFQRGDNAATINIKNSNLCAKLGAYSVLLASNGNFADVVNIKNSKVVNTGMIINPQSQINYINSDVTNAFIFDPPILATATQRSLNFNFKGAKIGQLVTVAFDKPLQGTRIWGEVTSHDTVTVYHRNDTGAAVDLPIGTLTVKIV